MRSIRWKIILLCLVTVVVPILLLNRYTVDFFDRFTRRTLEEHMADCAFLVGEEYKTWLDATGALPEPGRQRLQTLVGAYGEEVQARIHILSRHGTVLVDSGAGEALGADLSDRPEIRKALGGAYGARSALTPDRDYMFYYVALPIRRGEDVLGVAYVFRHTSPIIRAIQKMVWHHRLMAIGATGLAVLLGGILACTLTRRLRRLTAAATRFAKGDAPMSVQIKGRDEIAELATAVSRMAAELHRRNLHNRDFISTVVHELKMPLTAIKGAAELLEQGAVEDPTARTRFLANIRYEVDRMIRMVWELNELSRLDVEVLRGQKQRVDYCACVREILDRIMPTFDQEHARFAESIPEGQLITSIVPGRIEQVIANLLDNAFRYTPVTGEVTLELAPGADETVTTTVRDTGPGIAPANIGKVFDRFFTTEQKDIPKEYGSGLGLAVAKSIIENHQGTISVQSEPGRGASFSFTLPLG